MKSAYYLPEKNPTNAELVALREVVVPHGVYPVNGTAWMDMGQMDEMMKME